MRLSFTEFYNMEEYENGTLVEKLINYNNGAKYGQIVFFAGGAGSGKGFAIKNFINNVDFKIRDVDELKLAFQRLDDLKKFTTEELLLKYKDNLSASDLKFIEDHVLSKGYSLRDLNLKTPEHVYALHVLVAATGIKDKTLDLLLKNADRNTLPNIIFDTTFKDTKEIDETVPKLLEMGYKSSDIHLTWVLTNFEIAIENNAGRSRVVPADIMLKTHSGAAKTIMSLARDGLPESINGGFYVILNNPENTIYRVDKKTGEHFVGMRGNKVVESFLYLTLKKPGKPMSSDFMVKSQLYDWVSKNIPKEALKDIAMDKL
jgi:hypothetical protein